MKIEQRKDLLGNKVYTLKIKNEKVLDYFKKVCPLWFVISKINNSYYQVVFDMDVSLGSILNYLYNYHFMFNKKGFLVINYDFN